LRQLQLEQLQPAGREPVASGMLDGRLQLQGHGTTWHALAQDAQGEVTLVVPAGSVRKALAEGASADLAGALGLLQHSQRTTPIHCAVASLTAEHGVLRTKSLLLDTDASLLSGAGEINLNTQTLDLKVRGRPKHPTLALHSALSITGPLRHPHLALEKRGSLLQGGAALALGALLTPLAAALAFVDPGLAKDADCSAVLAAARAESGEPRLGMDTH
ncbi:MAG: AsmA family protein, partial [Gammaproteobacteria bacterium]|nr:AsmA family protein [Gammaproteobacteria bacterium]